MLPLSRKTPGYGRRAQHPLCPLSLLPRGAAVSVCAYMRASVADPSNFPTCASQSSIPHFLLSFPSSPLFFSPQIPFSHYTCVRGDSWMRGISTLTAITYHHDQLYTPHTFFPSTPNLGISSLPSAKNSPRQKPDRTLSVFHVRSTHTHTRTLVSYPLESRPIFGHCASSRVISLVSQSTAVCLR